MTCLAPHLALQEEEAIEESIAIERSPSASHTYKRYEGGTEAREYREKKDGEEDEASGEEKEASGEEKEASGEEASDSDKTDEENI